MPESSRSNLLSLERFGRVTFFTDVLTVIISEGMEGLVAPNKLYSTLAAGRLIVSIYTENSHLSDVFAHAKYGIVRNDDDQKSSNKLHQLSKNPRLTC